MEFWSYNYKIVEEPFTMRQTMTKYHPNHSEGVILLAGDQSRHGSSQKPWRGTKNFSGGPIFREKIGPPDQNFPDYHFVDQ